MTRASPSAISGPAASPNSSPTWELVRTAKSSHHTCTESESGWTRSPGDLYYTAFFWGGIVFYSVVLVSTVRRSRVPCAIQQVLISYLFYTITLHFEKYWSVHIFNRAIMDP